VAIAYLPGGVDGVNLPSDDEGRRTFLRRLVRAGVDRSAWADPAGRGLLTL